MIIPVSYRTDIPAFYRVLFVCRLVAGGRQAANPWNQNLYTIFLNREDVDGFVSWTRNLAPLAECRPEINKRAPFCSEYTVIGYPTRLNAVSWLPSAQSPIYTTTPTYLAHFQFLTLRSNRYHHDDDFLLASFQFSPHRRATPTSNK